MNDTAHATEEAHGAQNYDDDQEPFLDATDLAMQAAVELRHCVVRGPRRGREVVGPIRVELRRPVEEPLLELAVVDRLVHRRDQRLVLRTLLARSRVRIGLADLCAAVRG